MPDLVSLAAAVALETVDSRETGYSPSLDAGIATRPIEVLQPIQALAQARSDYLDAVLAPNFRLFHALGRDFSATTGSYLVPEWRKILITCVLQASQTAPDPSQIDFKTKHGV